MNVQNKTLYAHLPLRGIRVQKKDKITNIKHTPAHIPDAPPPPHTHTHTLTHTTLTTCLARGMELLRGSRK